MKRSGAKSGTHAAFHRKGTAIQLRRATLAHAADLIRLITALAHFEKLKPPNAQARARLIADGFGKRPRFETWLAFAKGTREPVGYALILQTYSSFLARPTLFLEDLFVLPDFRGRGIGLALFGHCVRLARERECGRMEWTALDWNRKAQAFYERLGARRLAEWYLYRLDRESLERTGSGQRGHASHR